MQDRLRDSFDHWRAYSVAQLMVGPVLAMLVAKDIALREAHEARALPTGEEPRLQRIQELSGGGEGGLR